MGTIKDIFKNLIKNKINYDIEDIPKIKHKNIVVNKQLEEIKENNIPWKRYQSIYSYIHENYKEISQNNGEFALPEDIDSKEKWGDTNSYISYSKDIDNIDEFIINIVTTQLIDCCVSHREEDYISLYNSLISTNIFLVMDSILDNLISRQEEFTLENLYLTGLWLCRDSCHRNAVLFGIAILGRIRLEEDIIDIFSRCNDFIYPICFAIMTEGKDINNKLMQLAENINGWDKIQIIDYIIPKTQEERSWFITKGIKCTIKSPILAKVCCEKSEIHLHISHYMDQPFTRDGVAKIISYFLDEDDYYEFIKYTYNQELIKKFVYYLKDSKLHKYERQAFKKIQKYMIDQGLENTLSEVFKIVKKKLSQESIT